MSHICPWEIGLKNAWALSKLLAFLSTTMILFCIALGSRDRLSARGAVASKAIAPTPMDSSSSKRNSKYSIFGCRSMRFLASKGTEDPKRGKSIVFSSLLIVSVCERFELTYRPSNIQACAGLYVKPHRCSG